MIEVIFDISVVGDPSSRSGLSRYGIEVAMGLHANQECRVSYCATGSVWAERWARRFLSGHPELSTAGLGTAGGGKILDLTERLNQKNATTARMLARGMGAWLMLRNMMRSMVAPAALAKADVFHSSYARIPREVRRKKLAKVLTVHDLIPLKFPQFVGEQGEARFRRILGGIGPGDWIVTVSESTKNDLCEMLKFDPARIFVTPLAASPQDFHPCADAQGGKRVREKYRLPAGPFVLSLATVTPHKNMDFLLRSFGRLIRSGKDRGLNLVLAGGRGTNAARIEKMMHEDPSLQGRVALTGYVEEADLAALYSAAAMFAFPSLYEGFGLPVVEAMQCGAPVLVSNRSSLPEVAGDAGRLLDPTDEEAWLSAMAELADDGSLRREMSRKSIARAATFSWGGCVEKTVAAYRAAVGSRE